MPRSQEWSRCTNTKMVHEARMTRGREWSGYTGTKRVSKDEVLAERYVRHKTLFAELKSPKPK